MCSIFIARGYCATHILMQVKVGVSTNQVKRAAVHRLTHAGAQILMQVNCGVSTLG